jgi:hypothetical protein
MAVNAAPGHGFPLNITMTAPAPGHGCPLDIATHCPRPGGAGEEVEGRERWGLQGGTYGYPLREVGEERMGTHLRGGGCRRRTYE